MFQMSAQKHQSRSDTDRINTAPLRPKESLSKAGIQVSKDFKTEIVPIAVSINRKS